MSVVMCVIMLLLLTFVLLLGMLLFRGVVIGSYDDHVSSAVVVVAQVALLVPVSVVATCSICILCVYG